MLSTWTSVNPLTFPTVSSGEMGSSWLEQVYCSLDKNLVEDPGPEIGGEWSHMQLEPVHECCFTGLSVRASCV